VGSGAVGPADQGDSVALSADGNTALVGGPEDAGETGAVWAWIRTGGVWTQQGPKLVGSGGLGYQQGSAVALSADGNTALIGGVGDDFGVAVGAAWVWTRTNGVWTQQGPKLVGSGAVGASFQGYSVALSADGNTAIVGGPNDTPYGFDNACGCYGVTGAAWVWTRTNGVWTQQGPKLVGDDSSASSTQGVSVALSADGNTALVGGFEQYDDGAVWVWTRTAGIWTQQGPKLIASGAVGLSALGRSVALSADGNIALVGGAGDPQNAGATWVWRRTGTAWTQRGTKLVGTGAVQTNPAYQSNAVALSADGQTGAIGVWGDADGDGGVWIFVHSSRAMSLDVPDNSTQLEPFTLSGWAIDDVDAVNGPGVDTVHVWAYPATGSPQFVGVASYGQSRSDVGTAFGPQFTNAGFALSVTGLSPGTYTLAAFAHSIQTGTFSQSQTARITIPSSLPAMSLDLPANHALVRQTFAVAGWAIDRVAVTGSGVDAVHVWAFPTGGGAPIFGGVATLGGARPDVGAVFGSQFASAGFSLTVTLPTGNYQLVTYAHLLSTGTFSIFKAVDITAGPVSSPLMAVDTPGNGAVVSTNGFVIGGWAIDQGASTGAGVDAIHVWAYPTDGGSAIFFGVGSPVTRTDVASIYGPQFVDAGFSVSGTLPVGTYTLVVYAHSSVTGTFNQSKALFNVLVSRF
jgi:hypothetical protein